MLLDYTVKFLLNYKHKPFPALFFVTKNKTNLGLKWFCSIAAILIQKPYLS